MGWSGETQSEMKKRTAQMMLYPTCMEERTKLVFKCLKNDNPTEFLLNCEWEIELVGNDVTDKEKLTLLVNISRFCCTKVHYCLKQLNMNNYEQFKNSFESRYWNIHIQRQDRDQLQNDRYRTGGKLTLEGYIIQLVERSKYLHPKFTEQEWVLKLAFILTGI